MSSWFTYRVGMNRRAVIYARISRDKVGAGLGVERQVTDCRELAQRLGWDVVNEHSDNDLSAYSGKPRPGYRGLLVDLEAGRADAVLAWHTDRLHRSPVELEHFISVCEPRGVPTHCVKAGELDLATPSGRMIARQLGAVARYEVEHAIERQKAAKLQAARAGKWRGGRRPYGWESDGVTVVPSEAAVVTDAAERVLAGESLNSVARGLNGAGHQTSTGGRWTSLNLRDVLMRARNFGKVEHHGELIADAVWAPILDVEVGTALRERLSDPSRVTTVRSAELVWLGSGLYRCGVCDNGTTVKSASSTGGGSHIGRPSYRCRASGHLTRVAQPVDDLVAGIVVERLSRPDAQLLLHRPSGEDVDALRTRSIALRARLDELAGLYADGAVSGSQLAEGTRKLRATLAEIETRMATAVAGSPLAGFADADDVATAWDAAPISRRKAIVDTLISVTLHKAPRGRRPGGHYFDVDSIHVAWKGVDE